MLTWDEGTHRSSAGFATSFEAVAARLPRSRIRGDIARGECPSCGSHTGAWVRSLGDGGYRVGCFACDDWRAVREALGLSRSSRRGPRLAPPVRVHRAEDAPDMVADADLLDRVYRVLLKHLPMSADQRRNVLGRDRGLAPDLRSRVAPLLGPIPTDPGLWRLTRDHLVRDLEAAAPHEFLVRVPELAGRVGRTLAVLPTRTRAQYFEPWTDEQGRIVALRAYMGRRAKPKYLTSIGRWGPLVHFAFGVPREDATQVPWVFTEGWMKAEVLAHSLGCVGVAFPGVAQASSWRRAVETFRRLAPDAPAYVAFDAEVWTTRPDIADVALEFAGTLLEATGRCPGFAVWDAREAADGAVHPKGIDDAIAAGLPVRLVDRGTFGAYLGPALTRWEERRAA